MKQYSSLSELTDRHVDAFLAGPIEPGPGGCRLWLGWVDRQGYGRIGRSVNGRSVQTGAHRIAYMLAKGDIPDGLVIDHLCRVRNCVNADHLEAVTSRVNTQRGFPGRKPKSTGDACTNGHPWTEGGWYYSPGRTNRTCRQCARESLARHRERHPRKRSA